jgi:hypothetical protein
LHIEVAAHPAVVPPVLPVEPVTPFDPVTPVTPLAALLTLLLLSPLLPAVGSCGDTEQLAAANKVITTRKRRSCNLDFIPGSLR